MTTKLLKTLSNNYSDKSLANKLRQERFKLFLALISKIKKPVDILDIGGTEEFWKQMQFTNPADINVTLVNITPCATTLPNFTSAYGDARNLSQFKDQSFSVVFSNSVIEHVGDFHDQCLMAREVVRIARCYFVQTPNFYFPIEPHFLFPGFQFLPRYLRVLLIRNYSLGWVGKASSLEEAESIIRHVQLLTRKKMATLFPDATIHAERFWGLTKSLIAIGGER